MGVSFAYYSNLHLYFEIDPSELSFILYTHPDLTSLRPGGSSTIAHDTFLCCESISLTSALCHSGHSGCALASLLDVGVMNVILTFSSWSSLNVLMVALQLSFFKPIWSHIVSATFTRFIISSLVGEQSKTSAYLLVVISSINSSTLLISLVEFGGSGGFGSVVLATVTLTLLLRVL